MPSYNTCASLHRCENNEIAVGVHGMYHTLSLSLTLTYPPQTQTQLRDTSHWRRNRPILPLDHMSDVPVRVLFPLQRCCTSTLHHSDSLESLLTQFILV